MKTAHLVTYDYGAGGVWAIMKAENAAAIVRRYPRLKVVNDRPNWMTDAEFEHIQRTASYDLDQEPDDFLRALAAEDP
jgi:hypothetical protein